MRPWLLWIIPPLAGAVIGYITNVVAIRMLFRPLKPVMVFGIRLPFTPGILPRQRRQLAESIGRMVEQELLTPEIIRKRLAQEDLREKLKERIAGYTKNFFSLPLHRLLSPAAPGPGGALITGIAGDFFHSENFDRFFKALITSLMEKPEVQQLLNRSILDREQGLQESVALRLEGIIVNQLRARSENIIAQLVPIAQKNFPQAADQLIRFLNRPDIHGELEIQGRIFLSSAILRLNVFQRFFLSAGQYDRTLQERMPEIIDDLIRQLGDLSRDNAIRDRLIAFGADALKKSLSDESFARSLARLVSSTALSHGDISPARILEYLGLGTPETLSSKLLILLRKGFPAGTPSLSAPSPEPGLLVSILKNLDKEFPAAALKDFLTLDNAKKSALDALLADKLLRIADGQIEAVLASINVQTLVSDRIDSLDMIRVERIVLDVMANQLKWIDIFGAILGFGIGVFQAGLSWFLR
ncbi:hypothetical protein AGMMS49546_28460 [Spirochaetia bacterium]|nr:hypothetical protein AGMMS49546_28460 [Spirochaetia bacterium]